MKRFDISTQINESGFEVLVNQKKYSVVYPHQVWQSVPFDLRSIFSEFTAFITTVHFGFNSLDKVNYHFPMPQGLSFFYLTLFLSMPENVIELGEKKGKTSQYIKTVLNSFYNLTFESPAKFVKPSSVLYSPLPDRAIMPFSFGKDSLLTYGLCQELGIKTFPIFLLEPSNSFENNHKLLLIKKFKKEFGQEIETFEVPLFQLKNTPPFWWGWDGLITQYTIFLIPYLWYLRPGFFFWSNEYDWNMTAKDDEGFLMNCNFDQAGNWMQLLDSMFRMFQINCQLGSLIEPLPQLSVLSILHQRYPKIAHYQSSCLNDDKISARKRWCGRCYSCAEVYVFLSGLNIDPKSVGLNDNMLLKNKRKYLFIFDEDDLHNRFTFYKNELHYCLNLLSRKGVKGGLIDEFIKRYGKLTKKEFSVFKKQYLTPKDFLTTPSRLRKKLTKIYESELQTTRKNLT